MYCIRAKCHLSYIQCPFSRFSHQNILYTSAEKQSALLTRLKQEQAELHHLQNVCRSAHRERKLLLKQQRELLAVQAATEQLWKDLHERVGKSLQEIHGTQEEGAQAPLIVSSSRREQSVDANNLHGKTEDTLREEAGEFPQKKQPVPDVEKTDVITDKNLNFCREYPIGSTLTDTGCKETKGYLVKEEQDTGLMKNPKEERLCSSMDKALQCSHPITPSDELYGFSLDSEKPRLESGFHTARAVLINISGSSPSSLEEKEDQDTDISLPEEFIIQDEMFCGTRGINTSPSSGGRSHTQIYGGPPKQVDLSTLCIQEGKPFNEKADRSAFIILSSDGRSNTDGMGGSYSDQTDAVIIRRDVPELEKMAFQEGAESEDVSWNEGSFDNTKDPKNQQIGSTIEGEDNHENPPCSKPMMLVGSEDVSRNEGSSDNTKDPKNQQIGSTVEGEDNHENPPCSKPMMLVGSEDVSWNEGSSDNTKDPKNQQIGSTVEGEDNHENPPCSKPMMLVGSEDVSWNEGSSDNTKDPKNQQIGSTVEGEDNHENPPCSKPMMLVGSEDVSWNEGSSDNTKDPKNQQIGSTVEGEDNRENPPCSKPMMLVGSEDVSTIHGEMKQFPSESQNPSDPLYISDDSKGRAEYAVSESNLYEAPPSNGSLCPQTMEGTTKQVRNCPTVSGQSSKRSREVNSLQDVERSEEDKIPIREEHPLGIEEEIVSPVDEVLSYGSIDLPSAVSFPSGDLPPPPEENDGGSDISLEDFPSPPEELLFPESGELQYASDEDTSITTNDLTSLSNDLELEDLPSLPLDSAEVSLGQ
nr:PREDICTED: midasin [Anolis carolinensis]|eukprot:XP_008122394.1 PREDICTED: midasin [Anolis carolinensis]